MAEAKSLLSLIARGYAAGREDAATEALCYILSRSESARATLSEILGYSGDSIPIASFSTQYFTAGAYPDMACLDDHGQVVAFVESKFWASLTSNQPVTYWEALPDDRPAVLLFLAPASRVARTDKDWLWDELVNRLREVDAELNEENRTDGLLAAVAKDGRRLMLTSWEVLLDRLAQRTEMDGDRQACFEVADLRGLAFDAIKDDDTARDVNLRQLIADAVKQVRESGWANTDGLRTGGSPGDHYARFFRLGGRITGLRIDYRAEKQLRQPLWLWFWENTSDQHSSVGFDEVRDKLGDSAKPGLEWLPKDVCIPIDLPAGAGREARLDALVGELKRIAKIIDPYVPTYHREPPTD